jgi:hypothetical protein
MNWKRGSFRLWIVASVGWLIFTAWSINLPLALSAFWNNYPSQHILDEERATGIKFDSNGNKCVEPPHHQPETAEEFLGLCTFSPLDDTPPITSDRAQAVIAQFAIEGLIPPMILLGVGLALVWAVAGFRRTQN